MTAVFIETGAKRVFVSALDWPGWSRGGRDEATVLESFVEHGPRYRTALGPAAASLDVPKGTADIEVGERLAGGAGTDFGVPSRGASSDDRPIDARESERLATILRACWAAFDAAAAAAVGVELQKGPRGGGRDLDKIVGHVWEADVAYHQSLGHPYRPRRGVAPRDDLADLHDSAIAAFMARCRDEPLPPSRRTSAPWSPRYYVRRAAWHALDHAWEIEDRSQPG